MPMDQPASNAVLITEMALWAQRTLGHLILAGVFERYPTLRFVPTEQGTLWVPPQLAMLDAMVFSRGHFAISMPGYPPLVLPAGTEIAHVVEDCRA